MCHPDNHYWDNYPHALSWGQVSETHLKLRHSWMTRLHIREAYIFCFYWGLEKISITVEPFWKGQAVPLKLQNLVHFHTPFFTNHADFTLHDRPPLLKGHHLGWPLQKGSTVYQSRYLIYIVWLNSMKYSLKFHLASLYGVPKGTKPLNYGYP